ncbi:MAG TPA: CsbD family protein [Thermoanaerobaculia bacterium]|nr:CsbD family protein [Thermoanaerobaculia bacterium]
MASGKEHQAEGKLDQVKGAAKEGFGALTGDRSTEAEGKAERAKGKIQEEYGRIKSDVKNEDKPRR